MSATVRTIVRGVLLGLPIGVAGVGLPLLVLLAARDPEAGYQVILAGLALFLGGCAWTAVGTLVRRMLRWDRARIGTCPFSGEPALVAHYSLVVASGWYVVGLGLLAGAGGMVAVALAPLRAGHLDPSLLMLLLAGMIYRLLGVGQVRHLLTGRIRRGGVWLTPTGLVHRSWDSGLAVRWGDLASVTFSFGHDVRIEPRPGAPAWLPFPPWTWLEVCGPDLIECRVLGRRAAEQIVALAGECMRDPATRATIGHTMVSGTI